MAWEEGLTTIINTRPANGFLNQEKDLLTHKERCVIRCWKEKLQQKHCIGTSRLSPALIWDNTSSKPGKNDRLAPPPQTRNAAMNPLCHPSTKNHWDYQSQTLPQGGVMLSLSTPAHLHAVSAKCFSPKKCGAAPELLAQSPPRKRCCKSV